MNPPPLRQKKSAIRSTAPQSALEADLLVANKYRLVDTIGTGSMGSVWLAHHVMLGHSVAIKFMHGAIDAYPEGRIRFEREAKLSARLGEASQHICKVTDFGVLDMGIPFVVMELLRGEELSQRLKRERRLPLPLVVDVVSQLCRALTVAHDAGVVHRDLKPANVFLCTREDDPSIFVKLLDFGVAKADLEHEDTQGTRAGTIFGTPGYMSPEQISADAELDPRSDLWSVVVMTYRMVVGHTPFGAGSLRELGMRILTTEPPLPSSVCPDLPPAFDDWVRRGLSKQRHERFSSATELASSLADALSGTAPLLLTRSIPPSRPNAEEAATFHAVSHSSAPAGTRRGPLRRILPFIGAAAGLAGGGLLAWSAFHAPAPVEHPVAIGAAAAPPKAAPATAATPKPAPAAQHTAEEAVEAEPAPEPQEVDEAAEDPVDSPPEAAQPAPPRQQWIAPRRAAPKASTPKPETSAKPAMVRRATELWNKKDEL